MTVFEGGTRVRGFINGKNLKPYVYDGMLHAIDWMPTILHAAIGVPVGL
jgi:arylsulfatase A-like enzyme